MKEQTLIYQKTQIWPFAYEGDKFQTWFKKNGNFANISSTVCFISEYLDSRKWHWICVWGQAHELVEMINETIPTAIKFKYFADRCTAWYKNFKNMLHLCRHKQVDFSIKTTWCSFATKHRKSPCDSFGEPMEQQRD